MNPKKVSITLVFIIVIHVIIIVIVTIIRLSVYQAGIQSKARMPLCVSVFLLTK